MLVKKSYCVNVESRHDSCHMNHFYDSYKKWFIVMMKVVSIVTRIHARLQRSKYLTAMCVIGVLIVHKDG